VVLHRANISLFEAWLKRIRQNFRRISSTTASERRITAPEEIRRDDVLAGRIGNVSAGDFESIQAAEAERAADKPNWRTFSFEEALLTHSTVCTPSKKAVRGRREEAEELVQRLRASV